MPEELNASLPMLGLIYNQNITPVNSKQAFIHTASIDSSTVSNNV